MAVSFGKIKYKTIALMILFACFMEFLYTDVTGSKTKYVLIILCAMGIFNLFYVHYKFVLYDFIEILVSIYILIYTQSSESLRYFLLIICLITWARYQFDHIEPFIQALVVTGGILCIFQCLQQVERAYGFFANSAPQMACVALVCEVYLLICICNEGIRLFNIFCIILCIFIMYVSGTRSALAVGCVALCGYLMLIFINRFQIKGKMKLLVIVIVSMIFILGISFPTIYEVLSSKLNRSAASNSDSSMTRMTIYKMLFGELSSSPKMLLIGNRAGYIEKRLMQFLGKSFYFPAHQDYLLITCEYGILGLIVIFVTFLRKHPAWIYFLMVFSLCSFHNILLTPTTMLLMVITMCDLERKNYHIIYKPNDLETIVTGGLQ